DLRSFRLKRASRPWLGSGSRPARSMFRGSRGAIEAQALSRPSSARLASSRVITAMERLRGLESGDWTTSGAGSVVAVFGGARCRWSTQRVYHRGVCAKALVILLRLMLAEQAPLARRGGGQHRRVEPEVQVGRELLCHHAPPVMHLQQVAAA